MRVFSGTLLADFHSTLQHKRVHRHSVRVQKVFQSTAYPPHSPKGWLERDLGSHWLTWESLRQAMGQRNWPYSHCPLCVPERVNKLENLTSHTTFWSKAGRPKRNEDSKWIKGDYDFETKALPTFIPWDTGKEKEGNSSSYSWEIFLLLSKERKTWLGQKDTVGNQEEKPLCAWYTGCVVLMPFTLM